MHAKTVMRRCRPAVALVAASLGACSGRVPYAGTLGSLYASPAESVQVLTLVRGETLGSLLAGSIKSSNRYAMMVAFQQQASPRDLKPGTQVTLSRLVNDGRLRTVDVDLSKDRTVRLVHDPLGGWTSETVRTPIVVDTLYAAGRIENSLWESVVDNRGLASMPVRNRGYVVDALDQVFQWQLDFSHQIVTGDTYRFVFEEKVRPDGSMSSGRILAAEIVNAGKPYYAVYFDAGAGARGGYYNLDGKALRSAFLRKPLAYVRISSKFSMHRWEPILHIWRPHLGVDYAAPEGTPVWATADGVVIWRGWASGYGNVVELRHPNGWQTRYAHLEAFRAGLHVGSRVHQGEVIGYVGETGLATGPHLHYEILHDGVHLNPLSVKLPIGQPIPAHDWAEWTHDMAVRVALLESIPGAGPVRTLMASANGAPPSSTSEEARGR